MVERKGSVGWAQNLIICWLCFPDLASDSKGDQRNSPPIYPVSWWRAESTACSGFKLHTHGTHFVSLVYFVVPNRDLAGNNTFVTRIFIKLLPGPGEVLFDMFLNVVDHRCLGLQQQHAAETRRCRIRPAASGQLPTPIK